MVMVFIKLYSGPRETQGEGVFFGKARLHEANCTRAKAFHFDGIADPGFVHTPVSAISTFVGIGALVVTSIQKSGGRL